LEHQNYRNSLFWSSEVLPLQHLMGGFLLQQRRPRHHGHDLSQNAD